MSHAQALCHVEKLENYPTQQGALKRCIWGYHLIVEFWQCPFEALARAKNVESALKQAVKSINSNNNVKVISYQFKPYGVSAQLNSGCANIYIHTWPENGYSAIDIMTPDKEEAYKILEGLKTAFSPKNIYVAEVPRGIVDESITEEWGDT